MTPSEFKAWMEGFSEGINGAPTKAQWAKIQEKIAKLSSNENQYHYHYRYGLGGSYAPWVNVNSTVTADQNAPIPLSNCVSYETSTNFLASYRTGKSDFEDTLSS